jgi:hypothetical protein
MAELIQFPSGINVEYKGQVNMGGASSVTYKAASITKAAIVGGTNLLVADLEHLWKPFTGFGLVIGGTVANAEHIVHVASTVGVIRGFHCTLNVGGSTGDSDFDLLVNGTSVLSALVNFANTDADKLVKDGTISTSALAADDIVSIKVIRNSSHNGTGPFAWAEIQEVAAAS